MHGEDDAVALPRGTTSTRLCMRGRRSVSTNSPPVKSRLGRREQNRDLQREGELAVQILMQTIIVAGRVLQQQRRRPGLAGGVAYFQIVGMRRRITDRRSCARSTHWRTADLRIERGSQVDKRAGSGYLK